MNAYRTQNIPAILFQRKESALRLSSSTVLLYFHSFILLQGIRVQERKSVMCNQRSSSAISGSQSRGGERWHNYISLLAALSSVNAVCVMLGKPFQACRRHIVNRARIKEA